MAHKDAEETADRLSSLEIHERTDSEEFTSVDEDKGNKSTRTILSTASQV